ncbi:MAG: sigma-70 family RNA polymerase sigma factor [Bacteroidota bacterium]
MEYTENSSESDLLEGCKARHRLAQKQLYKRFYSQMLGICMRYTKNKEEAVEVLNDSFLKVFQGIDQYNGSGALGAWVAKIVFYTAIDAVRRHQNYKKNIDLESTYESEVASDVIDQLSAGELMSCIQRVTPASQAVFSLFAVEGYSHKEIAEMLQISVGTSKWHLANARKELKAMLKSSGNYLIAI